MTSRPRGGLRRSRARSVRGRAACSVACVVVLALAVPSSPARAFSPEVNYALHCQGCHLADGAATPGLVPPIDGALGRFMRVREGRDYLLRLPNVVAAQLGDADTAALLNWVVRRFGASELPSDFQPFTTAEVVASRGTPPLVDVEGARRNVLRVLGEAPG